MADIYAAVRLGNVNGGDQAAARAALTRLWDEVGASGEPLYRCVIAHHLAEILLQGIDHGARPHPGRRRAPSVGGVRHDRVGARVCGQRGVQQSDGSGAEHHNGVHP